MERKLEVLSLAEMDKALIKVKNVCQKVEKATDSYKSVAEIVYNLHEAKAHKNVEGFKGSFTEFMRRETGMGDTTTKSLVRIWGTVKELEESGYDAKRLIFRNASMRELLTLTQSKDDFTSTIEKNLDDDKLLSEFKRWYTVDAKAIESKEKIRKEPVKEAVKEASSSDETRQSESDLNMESLISTIEGDRITLIRALEEVLKDGENYIISIRKAR